MRWRDYIFGKGDLPNVGKKLRDNGGYFSQGNFYHSLPALCQPPSDFQPKWEYYTKWHMEKDGCLLDPEIQQNIITNVLTQLRSAPHNRFVWVAMSDQVYYCRCNDCSDFYREHGRTSTYFNILDVVGDAIAEEFPDYYVVGLAYKYTWNLPKNFDKKDINENVIVCACTDTACGNHDHTQTGCTNKSNNAEKYSQILDAWFEFSHNVWVWDYTSDTTYGDAPFPVIHQMYRKYQDFHKRGVSGIIVLGDNINCAPFSELKAYLTSKLVWEADMTEAEYWNYVDTFLYEFYGDGWSYIREYIEKTYELQSENEWHIWTNCDWDDVITEAQYRENYDYLMGLFDKALELASTDEQKLRVRRSAAQMKYIEVCLAYEDYRASGDQADLDKYNEMALAYFDYLGTLEDDNYRAPGNWDLGKDPKDWDNDSK